MSSCRLHDEASKPHIAACDERDTRNGVSLFRRKRRHRIKVTDAEEGGKVCGVEAGCESHWDDAVQDDAAGRY
jgi:hypothetical protein